MTSSIRTNRYCFERCTKDEALAESIGGLKRYWVRFLSGRIDIYFDQGNWPEGVEFVRPVQAPQPTWTAVETSTGDRTVTPEKGR